ncbi:alpha/beta fold hydrolase [Shimia sp.]|uniref:alpha/beta fold hydrolase n=1 Tax=Shimia sp. TaxID=1954381 RepID=UPI003562B647
MAAFLTSDGLSLHYSDQGRGLPVLCLSGLTRNGSDFDYALPALAGCRVIRLDYRGRGRSDHAPDHMSYNIPRETQDVLELLEHLGLRRVAVLGTSRGGLIALTMAALVQDRLLGVCFVDIGPVIEMDGLQSITGFLGRTPPWADHAEAARHYGARLAGFANVPAERWLEEVRKHYPDTGSGLGITYDPKLRDAVLATFDPEAEPPDLWPLFEALAGKPVAAIRGAGSDILSAATLAEMQARLPGLIAATVPDRGHVPFLDEAESVAALSKWIKELQP